MTLVVCLGPNQLPPWQFWTIDKKCHYPSLSPISICRNTLQINYRYILLQLLSYFVLLRAFTPQVWSFFNWFWWFYVFGYFRLCFNCFIVQLFGQMWLFWTCSMNTVKVIWNVLMFGHLSKLKFLCFYSLSSHVVMSPCWRFSSLAAVLHKNSQFFWPDFSKHWTGVPGSIRYTSSELMAQLGVLWFQGEIFIKFPKPITVCSIQHFSLTLVFKTAWTALIEARSALKCLPGRDHADVAWLTCILLLCSVFL